MILVRRIIFFIFLGLYIILCPLLILYSFGYIYSPLKQEITQTGLIHLSSVPAGADIYLEKSRYREKSPASISGLIPGNYKITLRLKGYKSWVHNVSVSKGRAVAFDNILLIPKVWPIKNIVEQAFERLIPLRETPYFIISQGSNFGDYAVYQCKKKQINYLLSLESPLFALPVTSIKTQANSPILIIYSGALWNHKYFYITLGKATLQILDISNLIQEVPSDIVWDDAIHNKISVLYKGYLNLLDVESMSISPHFYDNINGYGLHDKRIYILNSENNLYRETYEKGQKELLPKYTQFENILFEQSKFYKIKVLRDNIILFLSQKGQLISNQPPYNLVSNGVTGLEFYKKIPKFLYWTKQSIGIVDFSQKPEEAFSTGRIVRDSVIYDTGENITDCFATSDGYHLLFNDNNILYLLEIEPQGKPHLEFIAKIKNNSSFFYSNETGLAYYLDPQSGYLNSIEIIPE